MMESEATSSLHTPLVGGVEGMSPSTAAINNTSISKEMEPTQMTENKACRIFNNLMDEELRNNENTTTINFEDFFTESTNQNDDNLNIMDMIDNFDFTLPNPEASTLDHLINTTEVSDTTTETVWAFETFEDNMVGLCLPAAEAEGGKVELQVLDQEPDLLEWIINDSKIEEFNFSQEATITTSNFVLEPLKEEEVVEKRKRIKIEQLTEEEKYRRMREQNNRASQLCRAKRKRKRVEEEDELTILSKRNQELRNHLEKMEEQVAEYKKNILKQVTMGRRQ